MLSICISPRFNKQFVSLRNGQRQVSQADSSFKNTSEMYIIHLAEATISVTDAHRCFSFLFSSRFWGNWSCSLVSRG